MDLDQLLTAATDAHRVRPKTAVDLGTIDPDGTPAFDGDKTAAKPLSKALTERLVEQQALLWAGQQHRVLLVLQAMDTGGKDGTIRKVFTGVNPQGVHVQSFKRPTEPELAHDYLWRVHPHVPGNGELVIFNRSHYEDVLVVRVRGLVPEERWRRRYEHIAAFEQLLADEGTTIVKVMLHISKEEQAERLRARLEDPSKHWKFEQGDLVERKRWDDYQAAYAEALFRTSTASAPWYVVPANRKWYRDLVVSAILVRTFADLGMQWPEAEPGLAEVVVED